MSPEPPQFHQPPESKANLIRNPISLIGAALAATSLATIVFLFFVNLVSVQFLLNGGNTDLVKLSTKRLDSFGSTATVFQFERCQPRRLTENLDLEIDEFADFSLDGCGWGCHHGGLLE